MVFKTIKCKECGTQEKALFQMQPSISSDNCFCKECLEKEREKRAKE